MGIFGRLLLWNRERVRNFKPSLYLPFIYSKAISLYFYGVFIVLLLSIFANFQANLANQLHQLRGRVGRGADQSYCILVTGYKLSEDTRKRIQIMVDTNDGFEIAEADLKLRGPGDLEGTQQSGVAFDLKIADIAKDGQLLQYVREIAERMLEEDPQGIKPEYAVVWQQLKEMRKRNVNWSVIS